MALLAIILPNAGCSEYSLTVNKQLLYSPPRIFTDFRLQDTNLQLCADATIKEGLITSAHGLHKLLCPGKGIQILNGIASFDNLSVLGLQDNNIANVSLLAAISQLKQLNLSGNRLADVAPLASLQNLHFLDLNDNPDLKCSSMEGIRLAKGGILIKPEHCR